MIKVPSVPIHKLSYSQQLPNSCIMKSTALDIIDHHCSANLGPIQCCQSCLPTLMPLATDTSMDPPAIIRPLTSDAQLLLIWVGEFLSLFMTSSFRLILTENCWPSFFFSLTSQASTFWATNVLWEGLRRWPGKYSIVLQVVLLSMLMPLSFWPFLQDFLTHDAFFPRISVFFFMS